MVNNCEGPCPVDVLHRGTFCGKEELLPGTEYDWLHWEASDSCCNCLLGDVGAESAYKGLLEA